MRVKTYREALNEALCEEMRRDESVLIMGEDIGVYQGAYGVTANLLSESGEKRVIDTPIAEEVIVGAGIGSAMAGLRPVVEIMTINFIALATDRIVNHPAKLRYMSGGQLSVPLVIRSRAGGGHQLSAQHSQSLEAWFMHTPGLLVFAPATPPDAKGLLKTAIRTDDPVLFIEHIDIYPTRGEVPDGDYIIPIGRADIKHRGADVTIVAYSKMTLVALQSAEELEKEGISVEIVDLRSLRPLDVPLIVESVKKTGPAVVVTEDWRSGGAGAEITPAIYGRAFDWLDTPVERIDGAGCPYPLQRRARKTGRPQQENHQTSGLPNPEDGRSAICLTLLI